MKLAIKMGKKSPPPRSRYVCAALGEREVAIAVLEGSRARYHVTHLHQIPSLVLKMQRFLLALRSASSGSLKGLAAVRLEGTRTRPEAVEREEASLREFASRRKVPVSIFTPREIKASLLTTGERPTNRALLVRVAELLELGGLKPEDREMYKNGRRRHATRKERYRYKAALASAGAYLLEKRLTNTAL